MARGERPRRAGVPTAVGDAADRAAGGAAGDPRAMGPGRRDEPAAPDHAARPAGHREDARGPRGDRRARAERGSGPVGPQPAVRGADAVPRRLGDGWTGGRDLRGRSSGRGAGQARGPGRRPAPRRRGHRRDEASLVADGSRARRPDRRPRPPPVRRAPRRRGARRTDPPGARVRGRVLGRRAVARSRGLPGRPRAGPPGAAPRARPSRAPPATEHVGHRRDADHAVAGAADRRGSHGDGGRPGRHRNGGQ